MVEYSTSKVFISLLYLLMTTNLFDDLINMAIMLIIIITAQFMVFINVITTQITKVKLYFI